MTPEEVKASKSWTLEQWLEAVDEEINKEDELEYRDIQYYVKTHAAWLLVKQDIILRDYCE